MSNNVIDLWFEELSAGDEEYQYYWRLLDEHEQAKALRFIQDKHRLHYVISHGKLRTILAGYTGQTPGKICFAQAVFGKPYIITDGKPHEVNFNLSHSGDKMLAAVGFAGPVGVDIEVWDGRVDGALIAKSCFADVEWMFWQELPDAEKIASFYRFWTRKESFAKAVGSGIMLDISRVVTSVAGTAGLLSIPGVYGAVHDWQLFDLDLGQGLSGALTVKNNGLTRIRLKTLRGLPYPT